MEQSDKCRIGIVDLMSFFWTLAGARKKGEDAFGLALQVLRYLRDRLEKHSLDAIAFCADGPGPSWRTAVDAAYKAHREEKPADRREELAALMTAMRGAGMCVIVEPASSGSSATGGEPEWFEGDDLCASVAAKALEGGDVPVVFSNDGDLAQLLALPGVELCSTRGEAITSERVFREWGVMPAKLGELKALAGDAGDGYKPFPGSLIGAAKGIGEKGAADLIKAFGGARDAMAAVLAPGGATTGAAKGLPSRLTALMKAGGQEALDRGFKLALLRTDAPVPDGIAEVTAEDWDAAETALKRREEEQRDAARLEDERAAERERDLRAESVSVPAKATSPSPAEGVDRDPDDRGGEPRGDGAADPSSIREEQDTCPDTPSAKRNEPVGEPARKSEPTGDGLILLTAGEYWALAVLPAAMVWLKIPAEAHGALDALSFALCGLFEPVADGSAFLCMKASKAAQNGISLLAQCADDIANGTPLAEEEWRERLIAQIDRIPGALRSLRGYGAPFVRART